MVLLMTCIDAGVMSVSGYNANLPRSFVTGWGITMRPHPNMSPRYPCDEDKYRWWLDVVRWSLARAGGAWGGKKRLRELGGMGKRGGIFWALNRHASPQPFFAPPKPCGRAGVRGGGVHARPHPSLLMPGPWEGSLMPTGACVHERGNSPTLSAPPYHLLDR